MNWKLILNEDDEPKWFPGETAPEGELMDNYLIRCLDETGNPIEWNTYLFHTPKGEYPKMIIEYARKLVKEGNRVEVTKEIAYSIKEAQ